MTADTSCLHIVEYTAPLRPHATFREAVSSRPRVKIGLRCEVLQAEFNTNNFGHFLHRGKQTKEEKIMNDSKTSSVTLLSVSRPSL